MLNGDIVYEGGMESDSVVIITIDVHYPDGAVEGQQILTLLSPGGVFETQTRIVDTELGEYYQLILLY